MTDLEAPLDLRDAPPIPGLRFRHYRGEADIAPIVEVIHAGRRADHVDWLPSVADIRVELANPVNEDLERDLIVGELDGRVIAYARAHWSMHDDEYAYFTECEVHPDARRRGIGRVLLRTEQDRLRAIAAQHPDSVPKRFHAWVLDEQAPALALLHADGYRPIRYFAEMSRPLSEPIEPVTLPDGLELRPILPEHRRRIFEAEAEAFRDHWGSSEWTDAEFDRTYEHPGLDETLWRVAWDGDEVAGVVNTNVPVEENEALGRKRGWLEHISVRRPWRRRGLAAAMIASAMIGLRERGLEEAALGVDADNLTGAFQLYEKLGFRVTTRATSYARPLEAPRGS